VMLGSKATTVAADGCWLEAALHRDATINNAAINRVTTPDQSGITLERVPLES